MVDDIQSHDHLLHHQFEYALILSDVLVPVDYLWFFFLFHLLIEEWTRKLKEKKKQLKLSKFN